MEHNSISQNHLSHMTLHAEPLEFELKGPLNLQDISTLRLKSYKLFSTENPTLPNP